MTPSLWIALLIGVGMVTFLPSRAGTHHFRSRGANVVMAMLVAFVVADVLMLIVTRQL